MVMLTRSYKGWYMHFTGNRKTVEVSPPEGGFIGKFKSERAAKNIITRRIKEGK